MTRAGSIFGELSEQQLRVCRSPYAAARQQTTVDCSSPRLSPTRPTSVRASPRRRKRPPRRRRAGRSRLFCDSDRNTAASRKNRLHLRTIRTNNRPAQYARACGRVSVGGDLDKRPVNRPCKDRQPEANRRTPPNGGRDLKQRRTGLFWSLPALQRSAYRRGLSILPGVRKGFLPSKRWL